MSQIISAVLIVGGTGLLFGCILALASFVFKVDEDERIEKILNALPGANCGGCGYAGCSAYAAAVVNENAPISACSVGKTAVSEKIAEIMGKTVEETTPLVAHVMCGGTCEKAKNKYTYDGIPDCAAAAKLSGGAKSCEFGCLGLGSCAAVCPFGAIELSNGIARIIPEKCVACGRCVKVCPKHIVKLVPANKTHIVNCSSVSPGAVVGKVCSGGCIGCKICEKNCPNGAVKVENNLAVIDYEKCTGCGICAEKCPKNAII